MAWTQTINGVLPLTPGTVIEVNRPVSPAGMVQDWPRVARAYQVEVPELTIVPAFAGLITIKFVTDKERISQKRLTALKILTAQFYRGLIHPIMWRKWIVRDSKLRLGDDGLSVDLFAIDISGCDKFFTRRYI